MVNKKLLKEEEAVLENPAKKSYIEKIVQGPRRPIPAKGKAILVSAIFFKEGNMTSQLPHTLKARVKDRLDLGDHS